MKSIRIGKSSSNDICINDVTVSREHAVITIREGGEVFIRDLGSTNGTFVNGKRIQEETRLTTKDKVSIAHVDFDWLASLNKYNHSNDQQAGKTKMEKIISSDPNSKTIGRTNDNDIVLPHDNVSSHHARLNRGADGLVTLLDLGSTNGTWVNGQRISSVTLSAGDSVMIANRYPLNWQNLFPVNSAPKPAVSKKSPIALIAAVIASLLLIGGGVWYYIANRSLSPEQIYSKYERSVVLVMMGYYYEAYLRGEKLCYIGADENGNFRTINGGAPKRITGTGFFVSDEGLIATNYHVAQPWMFEEEESNGVKKYIQQMLLEGFGARSLTELSEIEIRGRLEESSCGIFLNNSNVNSEKDIIPCSFVGTSESKDIDVALLQTNSKSLPTRTTYIKFEDIEEDPDATKLGKSVYTIGFPSGFGLAQTSTGIQAHNESGEITQVRGTKEFGHNMNITHGASGSPVFNDRGKLVGLITSGYFANVLAGVSSEGKAVSGSVSMGYNMAVKSKYLKDIMRNEGIRE